MLKQIGGVTENFEQELRKRVTNNSIAVEDLNRQIATLKHEKEALESGHTEVAKQEKEIQDLKRRIASLKFQKHELSTSHDINLKKERDKFQHESEQTKASYENKIQGIHKMYEDKMHEDKTRIHEEAADRLHKEVVQERQGFETQIKALETRFKADALDNNKDRKFS
jgi:DNA anti-recombination protein RmuC